MLSNNTQKVVIIDYGMGNLRSVQKKFQGVGASVEITNDPTLIAKADKLVLPGVGCFANGIKKLKEIGVWDVLNIKVLSEFTPVLGICLGMQLMAKHSEEGDVEGLGWFDARVVRFRINDTLNYKVPHMGWNSAVPVRRHKIVNNVNENSLYYFVHSYHIECDEKENILTKTEYDYEFVSAIQKENIFGTQFHPEKSHDLGEQVFKNFVNL